MKKKLMNNPELSENEMKEFEQNVKDNMKRAYFTALGFVGSQDQALELSQEAFIRAYRHYGSFDKNKKFFTWYYRILKNLCLNFIRDSKKKKVSGFVEIADMPWGMTPEESIELMELKDQVQAAIMKLNNEEREIIILKEFQNLSYKEIAETLDIPVGTVMSKLFYSRKKLAFYLKEAR